MALNPKQFGTVMKNARMDKKLTQAELAEILDLSLSYLKDLERFKNTPSLEVFARTIQYFNLSADTVIYPDKNLQSNTHIRKYRDDYCNAMNTNSKLSLQPQRLCSLLMTANPDRIRDNSNTFFSHIQGSFLLKWAFSIARYALKSFLL